MTMRQVFVSVLTVQMIFSGNAFAGHVQGGDPTQDMTGTPGPNGPDGSSGEPPKAPPGSADPKGTAEVPKPVPEVKTLPSQECKREIACTPLHAFYRDKQGQWIKDKTGRDAIVEQLHNNPGEGCTALLDPQFLKKMANIYDRKTEAGTPGYDCPDCQDQFREILKGIGEDKANGKLPGEAKDILRQAQCSAPPPKKVVTAPPAAAPPPAAPPPAAPPPANADAPPDTGYTGRRSSYGQREAVPVESSPVPQNSGGGGSFMNSNLMWGLGGALIGGLIGYQLGKNSMQNQYPYQMPYWQQLGPRPYGLGQVPGPYGGSPFGYRPGLPNMYPLGGGFGGVGGIGGLGGIGGIGYGGAPAVLPYGGQFGQAGYNNMMPIGGYTGGFGGGAVPFGNTYPGGYGLGTSFSTPVYNGGAAPMYLPYFH